MNKVPERFPTQLLDRSMANGDRIGDLMIQLELQFPHELDADRLAKAAHLTLDAEPILGCRYADHWRKPYWESIQGARDVFTDVRTEADFEAFKCASIDRHTAPQISVCLWNLSGESRLLLKVSHLVADAGGVKDVAAVLSGLYSQLGLNPGFEPEPNLGCSRGVREILRAASWRRYTALYLQFLRDDRTNQKTRDTLCLAFNEGGMEPLSFLHRFLSRDNVSHLVEYGRKYGATLNDMLLAAFFRGLATVTGWDGRRRLKVTTPVDLRRYVANRESCVVANYSTWVEGWPDLGTELGKDFPSTLAKIAAITRKRKANFIGMETLIGILVGLGPLPNSWAVSLINRATQRKIDRNNIVPAFTNMGVIDPSGVAFEDKPYSARLLPPPFYPPFFCLGASTYDRTLALSAGVYPGQRDPVGRFLDAMIAELPVQP